MILSGSDTTQDRHQSSALFYMLLYAGILLSCSSHNRTSETPRSSSSIQYCFQIVLLSSLWIPPFSFIYQRVASWLVTPLFTALTTCCHFLFSTSFLSLKYSSFISGVYFLAAVVVPDILNIQFLVAALTIAIVIMKVPHLLLWSPFKAGFF